MLQLSRIFMGWEVVERAGVDITGSSNQPNVTNFPQSTRIVTSVTIIGSIFFIIVPPQLLSPYFLFHADLCYLNNKEAKNQQCTISAPSFLIQWIPMVLWLIMILIIISWSITLTVHSSKLSCYKKSQKRFFKEIHQNNTILQNI